jgi:hypothetical protein
MSVSNAVLAIEQVVLGAVALGRPHITSGREGHAADESVGAIDDDRARRHAVQLLRKGRSE